MVTPSSGGLVRPAHFRQVRNLKQRAGELGALMHLPDVAALERDAQLAEIRTSGSSRLFSKLGQRHQLEMASAVALSIDQRNQLATGDLEPGTGRGIVRLDEARQSLEPVQSIRIFQDADRSHKPLR